MGNSTAHERRPFVEQGPGDLSPPSQRTFQNLTPSVVNQIVNAIWSALNAHPVVSRQSGIGCSGRMGSLWAEGSRAKARTAAILVLVRALPSFSLVQPSLRLLAVPRFAAPVLDQNQTVFGLFAHQYNGSIRPCRLLPTNRLCSRPARLNFSATILF